MIELASGKGALAVLLARELGCRVTGVDAFAPFIAHAQEWAAHAGVARRCEFRVGNVSRFRAGRAYDAALMIGLFGLERAAPLLRAAVKPDGVYLIDDAFLASARRHRTRGGAPGDAPTRAEAQAFIAGLGDHVEELWAPTPSEVRRLNASLYRRLARRADLLAQREPGLAAPLRRFLANQRRANSLMPGRLRPAIWLVRRGR